MLPRPAPSDLSRVPLFGGLPEDALRAFADQADVQEVMAGQEIFREGEPARQLYVVVSGALHSLKQGAAGDVEVWRIGPGDVFGEMSFIDMQPRSATVRATTDALLWGWAYSEFHARYAKELKVYTLLVMNIARELSRRLRRADDRIARNP